MARRPRARTTEKAPDLWPAFWEKLSAAKLTERQRKFVTEYIRAPIGARAARTAGYSVNRARQQAYDNRHKAKIWRLIEEGLHLFERDCYVSMGLMPPELCYKSPIRTRSLAGPLAARDARGR